MKKLLSIGVFTLAMILATTLSVHAQEKSTKEVTVEKKISVSELSDTKTPASNESAMPGGPKKACCANKSKDGASCKKEEGKACCKKDAAKTCDKPEDGKKCEKDCKKACCAEKKTGHEGHHHD